MTITFKQYIDEARMSKSVFSAAIARLDDAQLGFELEMWVTENSDILIMSDERYIGDFAKTAEEARKSLEDYLGVDVVVGESADKWKIVPDGSVQGSDDGVGIELVSPPLPVQQGLEDLESCFRWMVKREVETNSTTGIHLNISIPNLRSKLDPLKLILFMGEEHVLKSYARETNTYATKHYSDLVNSIKTVGRLPREAKQLQTYATALLQDAKYRTVNLSKLRQGYLEFRTGGNEGYHKKYKQIESDVGRFLTVLELACDPEAEKNEYAKKLAKLFNAGRDAKLEPKPGSYGGPKADSLERIIGRSSINRLKAHLEGEDADRVQNILVQIMDSTGHAIKTGEIDTVPLKAVAEFKVLFGRARKLSPDMLRDIRKVADTSQNADSDNINAFAKAFNLK